MSKSIVNQILLGNCILFLLISLSCSSPEKKQVKHYEKGKALYEQGEYAKAGLEFKNVIKINPNYTEAHYMLGMAELQRGNLQ